MRTITTFFVFLILAGGAIAQTLPGALTSGKIVEWDGGWTYMKFARFDPLLPASRQYQYKSAAETRTIANSQSDTTFWYTLPPDSNLFVGMASPADSINANYRVEYATVIGVDTVVLMSNDKKMIWRSVDTVGNAGAVWQHWSHRNDTTDSYAKVAKAPWFVRQRVSPAALYFRVIVLFNTANSTDSNNAGKLDPDVYSVFANTGFRNILYPAKK